MSEPQIKFDDGAAYEQFMGVWSHAAGKVFLDWLKPATGLHWLDVGCGNGAFTQMIIEHCDPDKVAGIDPSDGQLAFARSRPHAERAEYRQGDAMALPYADQSFDAAVMALVIFFVPEPERGVAEMVRVCKPGASISTYAWDIPGGGFPYAITQEEMEAFGSPSVWPPSKDAAKMENLQALWSKAGIIDLDTKVIEVKRRFENFDTFWSTMLSGPSAMKRLESLSAADRATFQQRVRARVTTSDHDGVVLSARANAIKGRLPG